MQKTLILFTFLLLLLFSACTRVRPVWTLKKANDWYATKGWMSGVDFIPSSAVNQLEMWQAATFDSAGIDRELDYASGLGFNAVRVYLHHLPWVEDATGFKKRMDTYLAIADRHRIGTIFVFFDDCWNDYPKSGPQPAPQPGIHNSGWVRDPGSAIHHSEHLIDTLQSYVKDVLQSFKSDKRIVMWDLYNEPGNSGYGDSSTTLLTQVFQWGRQVNPDQPLTSGVWMPALVNLNKIQLEKSDIITYHNYQDERSQQRTIDSLRKFGRPLICTEYMARTHGSRFENILPMLKEEKVSAISWGLVDGKTNTKYAWNDPIPSGEDPKVWFHDILHKNGLPYDSTEVRLIKEVNGVKP